MGEDAKVAVRNERRDAIKHIDVAAKDKNAHISEDDAKRRQDEVEQMTKKHIDQIEQMATKKSAEVMQI